MANTLSCQTTSTSNSGIYSSEVILKMWKKFLKVIAPSDSKEAEHLEISYIAGGNITRYSYYGKLLGSFSKINTKSEFMLQKFHL